MKQLNRAPRFFCPPTPTIQQSSLSQFALCNLRRLDNLVRNTPSGCRRRSSRGLLRKVRMIPQILGTAKIGALFRMWTKSSHLTERRRSLPREWGVFAQCLVAGGRVELDEMPQPNLYPADSDDLRHAKLAVEAVELGGREETLSCLP